MLITVFKKKFGADSPQTQGVTPMLRVKFNAEFQGVKIDDQIEAVAPMAVVYKLRKTICGKTAKKVLGIKIKVGSVCPQLDPENKAAWTNEQFYGVIVNYYNDRLLPKGQPKVSVPKDEQEFIDTCVRLGFAKVV